MIPNPELAIALDPLQTRLGVFDQLLRIAVSRARALGFQQGEYQGLFVDDAEADRHLANPLGASLWQPTDPTFDMSGFYIEYAEARDHQLAQDLHDGTPFGRLAAAFGLSALECDLLVLALAPELDRRYERLYSYLQDDVTRRRPTLDFALSLFAETFQERADVLKLLSPGSPLIDFELVMLAADPAQRDTTQISHFLRADVRLTSFLLGIEVVDSRLGAALDLQNSVSHPMLRFQTEMLEQMRATATFNPVYYFYGTYGAGMGETVSALCEGGYVRCDLIRLRGIAGDTLEKHVRLALRESRLRGCAILLEGWLSLLDDRHVAPPAILKLVLDHPLPVYIIGSEAWEPHNIDRSRLIIRLEFPSPEYDQRMAYWRLNLGDAQADPSEVANKFKLTGGQIRDAVHTARDLAAWRGEAHPTVKDLYAGARAQSNRKLSNLAQKIEPRYTWADIILPEDHVQQLQEIVNQVQYAQQVYGDWGFRGRAKDARGITALFAGESGTGKTMSADVIGHELGLDLYRIDLSTVVSKYIGETEKNLGAIFDEASQSNAILFFDEADSLFGKRSEVKDSHDRYANIETGYLLQRMESYSGVAILATNRLQDLDKAFIRRLDIVITYPSAEKSDRARIWQVNFPKNAPLDSDVDFDDLAKRFRQLAGGNIRNVVHMSAFVAATEGSSLIALRHIEHAVKREYQKMSKLVE